MTGGARPAGGTSPWWALVMLTCIYICGFVDRIIMQTLVEPVKAEFHLSDFEIGIVAGLAFAVLNVALSLIVARFAERCRRMSLVTVGTVLWSIATAACGMTGNFIHLVLARIGVGVGEAVGLPSSSSIISDYFPKERRSTALSVLMLAPPIGAFFGFVNTDLIPHLKVLRERPNATPRQKVISEIFSGVERTRIDTERNLLDVLDKAHEISSENVDPTHIFTLSQIYEGLLLKMGEKGNDGGQFFTPREIIRTMEGN